MAFGVAINTMEGHFHDQEQITGAAAAELQTQGDSDAQMPQWEKHL